MEHGLWWQGPSWLRDPLWKSSRPTWSQNPEAETPERRVRAHTAATKAESLDPEILTRLSSLSRLLRVTPWCRRWLRCVGKPGARPGPAIASPRRRGLHLEELTEARLVWIRLIQGAWFQRERTLLERSQPLPARSELIKLSPFLDQLGILRVGGRLGRSALPPDQINPAILPRSSRLTALVIEAGHRRTLHGGVQLTLETLRQEFWIPRGRLEVKKCIYRCVKCLRWRAVSPQPIMSDLLSQRVTPSRPFLNTGVDYAGPVWLRTSKGRGHKASKAFLAVFVCLCTRAIHLEVVSDYSTAPS